MHFLHFFGSRISLGNLYWQFLDALTELQNFPKCTWQCFGECIFHQVPGSEDVPGEVAGAAPAEDGLGGEGGRRARDGCSGDNQPHWVATNQAEATTAALEDYSGGNNKNKPCFCYCYFLVKLGSPRNKTETTTEALKDSVSHIFPTGRSLQLA